MSILPFSNYLFFILLFALIGFVFVSKLLFKKVFPYKQLILSISLFYIIFFYPKPIHILIFVAYSYLIYFVFTKWFKNANKFMVCMLLLLPMILVKSDIRVDGLHWNSILSMAGLSYISFRTMGLFMDNTDESKPINILDFISFLLFVPTLLIGPIDRYNRFKTDIDEGYNGLNKTNFTEGFQILIYGIMHKFVIAEIINRYWLEPIDIKSTELLTMANSMYAYFFYLYFDFAGYSSLAVGAGKMLGIDVPINFNKPFLAVNPQDFWRRWHKTLGDWLCDYFFTPFYKSLSSVKKLKTFPLLRQNLALFMTFFLMGCWNGFKFNYILSGSIFGLYSIVHNSYYYHCRKQKRDIVFGKLNLKLVKVISIFIMFNLVAFSIYIFSGRMHF